MFDIWLAIQVWRAAQLIVVFSIARNNQQEHNLCYRMSLFLFMGILTSVVLVCLLYTEYKWLTFLYMAWYLYDSNTPLKGGRNFK